METKLLDAAVLMAFEFHGNQTRKFSKEPYINHCLRVGSLVGDYTDDGELVAAALTHDLLEDTIADVNDIKALLGSRVASLVLELTENKSLKHDCDYNTFTLNKFDSISNDAFTIKLIDRLDNLAGLINNTQAPSSFIKKYVDATDYTIDNLTRSITSIHSNLLGNLKFVNNYLALTILR